MNASAQPAGTALSCTAILDAMPIGVAVVNQEGTIESANLTFARLTDVDRGALVHAPAQEILGLASAAMSAALAECDTFGEASLPVNASPAGRPLMVHLSAVFSDGADRRILTATPLPAHDHIPIGSSNTAAGPAMPLAPSAPVPPAPSHNRLLLVEDDSVVAMVARAHLEELGLTVDVARTGRRAMELTEAQAYRWVILDCILPDVDGFAVFQHLRHLPNTHRPERIIATSGLQNGALPGAMSDAPVDGILPKPIHPHSIRAALGLERPKSTAPSSADAVFDPHTIECIRALPGGASFMDDVLRAFLSDVSEAHAILARAFGEQDFRTIARTAHRLQGAAAAVGALQVEERCVELQQAASGNQIGPLAVHITRFAQEVQSVELALSDFYQ